METLLNELFTLDDQQQIEKIITDYANDNDIKIT